MLKPFELLVENVQACRQCARMEGRTRVLGPANGSIEAGVLFVAEAPGRLGADRTGIPLSADRTGLNFERLLASAGIDRSGIFVTNAVLCNPRDARGRNAPPALQENRNCAPYLGQTIDIVQPHVVVSLGVAALASLAMLAPHGLRLARDVGTSIEWRGRRLVPLYHPGPRALIHRPLSRQIEDYRRLATVIEQYGGVSQAAARRTAQHNKTPI